MHTLWAWLAEPPGKTPYTIGLDAGAGRRRGCR